MSFAPCRTIHCARTNIEMSNKSDSDFRKAGVEHDVINGNDFECAFIEVEFLDRE